MPTFLTPPGNPTSLRAPRPDEGADTLGNFAGNDPSLLGKVAQMLVNLRGPMSTAMSGLPQGGSGAAVYGMDSTGKRAVAGLQQKFPKVLEQANTKLPDIEVKGQRVSDAVGPYPISGDARIGNMGPGQGTTWEVAVPNTPEKGVTQTPESGLLGSLLHMLYNWRPNGPPSDTAAARALWSGGQKSSIEQLYPQFHGPEGTPPSIVETNVLSPYNRHAWPDRARFGGNNTPFMDATEQLARSLAERMLARVKPRPRQ